MPESTLVLGEACWCMEMSKCTIKWQIFRFGARIDVARRKAVEQFTNNFVYNIGN
jgi:hypothetical protein